ncbi:hypothetical protein BV898_04134 [Hypsibius exemplaris]|uniref:WH2 domain-containing protein n=1 Tax=Hypsibius exemplaris TaxID=2072580 RepID=A0A1W0X3B6_HYPEX|nr:hypothetical protein BV898_04134 [Hypsibius exemplaris]
MKRSSPAPPPPPPPIPVARDSSSAGKPPPVPRQNNNSQRCTMPSPDRSAVMADIRRAPRLKRVDRSLIQDRSEASLYFGEKDVPERLVTVHLPGRNSSQSSITSRSSATAKPSSQQGKTATRTLSGGANGAIVHPILTVYSRTPTPSIRSRVSTPISSQKIDNIKPSEEKSRRPSSALSTMARVLSRSPSPSASYQSVLNLFPSAARALTPNKVDPFQLQQTEVKKIKRQAPPIPARPSQSGTPTKTVISSQRSNPPSPAPTAFTSTNNHSQTLAPLSPTRPLAYNYNRTEAKVESPPIQQQPVWARDLKSSRGASPDISSRNGRFAVQQKPQPLLALGGMRNIHYDHSSFGGGMQPFPKEMVAASNSPSAALTRTTRTLTKRQAFFETKFTFHSVTDLVPEEFGHLKKTLINALNDDFLDGSSEIEIHTTYRDLIAYFHLPQFRTSIAAAPAQLIAATGANDLLVQLEDIGKTTHDRSIGLSSSSTGFGKSCTRRRRVSVKPARSKFIPYFAAESCTLTPLPPRKHCQGLGGGCRCSACKARRNWYATLAKFRWHYTCQCIPT